MWQWFGFGILTTVRGHSGIRGTDSSLHVMYRRILRECLADPELGGVDERET
jgi:hypothetical protein